MNPEKKSRIKRKKFYYLLSIVLLAAILITIYNKNQNISGRQVSDIADDCQNPNCIDTLECRPNSDFAFSNDEISVGSYKSVECTCENGRTFSETRPCSEEDSTGVSLSSVGSSAQTYKSPAESQQGGQVFEESFAVGPFEKIQKVIVTNEQTNSQVAIVEIKEEKVDIIFGEKSPEDYPEHCYNGEQDVLEERVDCGLKCKKCPPLLAPPKKKINLWWSVFLVLVFIYLHVSNRREK